MTTHTLLDRFLRYVRIDTKADEKSTTYPSSPGQLVLGAMLRDELFALGLSDAIQNEHGLVFATVPGNVPGAPTSRSTHTSIPTQKTAARTSTRR